MTAELPGLKESDVQVEVEDDCLCVRGEKREEKEEKNGGRYFSERRYGSFERIVRLPADADKDKINAQLTDGILKVTIPKAPGHKNQKKKIAIKH
jgi:HSP20 family protein